MNFKDYPIIEDEKGNNEEKEEAMVDEVKIFEIFKLSHEIKTDKMIQETMGDENEIIKNIINHEIVEKMMVDENEIIKNTKVIETTMNNDMDEHFVETTNAEARTRSSRIWIITRSTISTSMSIISTNMDNHIKDNK